MISASVPAESSCSTATRDWSDSPSPSRTASLIAPFEPSVRVCGRRSWSARNSVTSWRVPEPGSRISHTRFDELLGPHGLRAGELVAGSRDQRDRVLEEGVPGDPLVLGRPAGDRDVDLVLEHAVEDRGPVRHLEREVDLRVHRGEGAQQRGDDELGRGRDGDDAQRAHRDVRGLACRLLPLLDQPEDVGGVRPERIAGGGQPDAAPDALGQVDAELARERRDRCGDRRLRDVELLGRSGDGALTGDGEKARKLIQGDGHRRIII